jgi:hypothetical protein
MSDLVERLRQGSDDLDIACAYCSEAAARIETLEAALTQLVSDIEEECPRDTGLDMARAALVPEQDK